jgi:hypothetical protein
LQTPVARQFASQLLQAAADILESSLDLVPVHELLRIRIEPLDSTADSRLDGSDGFVCAAAHTGISSDAGCFVW